MSEQVYFVVDTEQYAGEFERELVAYMTGHHNYTHGEKQAEVFQAEVSPDEDPVFDMLEFIVSDSGHAEYAGIEATPGWFNHGLGGFFKEGQEEEALQDRISKVHKAYEKNLNAYKHYKDTEKWEEIEKDAASERDERLAAGLKKYPAYMSVSIRFIDDTKPSKECIDFLKRRAYRYANHYADGSFGKSRITITGFRLVTKRLVSITEDLGV